MTIALRDYQQEALEDVLSASKDGIKRQLIALPTGSGKTVVMSGIAKAFNKRTLILAHRQELIDQTVDKLRLVWPEISVGICMAERDEIDAQVVVGSVQSCCRQKRLEKLKAQGFDLLMIDECHHAIAQSYQDIINTLGFGEGTDKLLLGVTATPDRDGLGLIFDKVTFARSISTMISSGYLSPVVGRKIQTNFTLEKIRTQNGDFAIEELAEAVNTPERNAFIVSKFKEYAHERKSIAFCVDVQHCKDLAAAFQAEGINCQAIWGDMAGDERKRTLENLKHGRIQSVTSCGVLTEGFDESSISCVVMGRPTKSKTLYTQSVGRGLRIHLGKENCLVLDFCDRFHNLDTILSLNKSIPGAIELKEKPEKEEEQEEINHTPKITTLEEIDTAFDILGRQRFLWVAIGEGEWSLQDDEKLEIVLQPKESGYVATLYRPDFSFEQVVNTPLPLEYAQGVCEDYARRHLKIAFADAEALWMKSNIPPTAGQISYLEKLGVNDCEGITRAGAALRIRELVAHKNKQRRAMANEPLTDKQKYFLKSYDINTENMSKMAAMLKIAELKQKVS
jgi:superfamily II DNA or RNA helicase